MKHRSLRFTGLVALLGALFCLSQTSQAGGRRPSKPPPKIPYTAIVSVDQTAKTITVEPKNSAATGSKTYKFTDKTVITSNGKPGTTADLTPGQQVHIGAGMDGTTAEEIKVTPPPADPQYAGHHNP